MSPANSVRGSRAAAPLAIALLAALLPALAQAELSNDSMLGPGLRSRPAYDGSASQQSEVVPVVRFLGEPWFLRSTQGVLEGGWRVVFAPGLHAGAQLAYEPGRRASESDFLARHAIADIGRGASLGLQLEWDVHLGPMPLTLLGRWRQNTDRDLGAQADARLSAGIFQSGPVALGVFTQASWGNAKSNAALYSVTPAQSVASGLPAYLAGSGMLFASAGLLGSWELAPRWVVVGSAEARRLQGDAASSPLAERVGNHAASIGLAYRF